jgi:sensor histidine kinase YesM
MKIFSKLSYYKYYDDNQYYILNLLYIFENIVLTWTSNLWYFKHTALIY